MAKINPQRIQKKYWQELEWTVLTALRRLGLTDHSSALLRKLFTESEIVILARRIKVAERLLRGIPFEEIQKELGVGLSTIRFVHRWLGDDLQKLQSLVTSLEKDRAEKKNRSLKKSTYWEIDPHSFDGLRSRYPQYFPILNFLLGDPREKYQQEEEYSPRD
jgi:uncharacterized protein YerC